MSITICDAAHQDVFNFSLSLGLAVSSAAVVLAARGEGANGAAEGPRLNPKLGVFAVGGGGLVAEVEATGAAPLLNSAQRGHLRLVSE